jgi:hypothetical protein
MTENFPKIISSIERKTVNGAKGFSILPVIFLQILKE